MLKELVRKIGKELLKQCLYLLTLFGFTLMVYKIGKSIVVHCIYLYQLAQPIEVRFSRNEIVGIFSFSLALLLLLCLCQMYYELRRRNAMHISTFDKVIGIFSILCDFYSSMDNVQRSNYADYLHHLCRFVRDYNLHYYHYIHCPSGRYDDYVEFSDDEANLIYK